MYAENNATLFPMTSTADSHPMLPDHPLTYAIKSRHVGVQAAFALIAICVYALFIYAFFCSVNRHEHEQRYRDGRRRRRTNEEQPITPDVPGGRKDAAEGAARVV